MKYFISASSLPVNIWPILGLSIASARRGSDLNFSYVAIIVPLAFGLTNYLTSKLPIQRTRRNMFFLGLGLGVIMATIGSSSNIPSRVYGLEGSYTYLVFIGGPLFYGLVWSLALFETEKIMFTKK